MYVQKDNVYIQDVNGCGWNQDRTRDLLVKPRPRFKMSTALYAYIRVCSMVTVRVYVENNRPCSASSCQQIRNCHATCGRLVMSTHIHTHTHTYIHTCIHTLMLIVPHNNGLLTEAELYTLVKRFDFSFHISGEVRRRRVGYITSGSGSEHQKGAEDSTLSRHNLFSKRRRLIPPGGNILPIQNEIGIACRPRKYSVEKCRRRLVHNE